MLAQETIRNTAGDYPPLLSEQSKHYGLWARICTAAFAEVNISTTIQFFPWKRGYRLAKDGEWDATMVWFYSPERERDFYYSEPFDNSNFIFFYLKTLPFDWKTLTDLKGFRICGVLEYTYPRKFLDAAAATPFKWGKDLFFILSI